MTKSPGTNRRQFLQLAGLSAIAASSSHLRANEQAPIAMPVSNASTKLAFVSSFGARHGVHVFATGHQRWQPLHFVATPAPISLVIHPTLQTLYVLNAVDVFESLPRGSVEAWRYHPTNGNLTLINRQPLSLSATAPRHIAISPDGNHLAVAVAGGGAWNLLPLNSDGAIDRVSSIRKEHGFGPVTNLQATAHPQTAVFTTAGNLIGNKLIGTDLGSDRVSVFAIDNATIKLIARHTMPAGSGPRHIALHAAGKLLFVDHAISNSISALSYSPTDGITESLSSAQGPFGDALAIHPTADVLYSARGTTIASWSINPNSGELTQSGEHHIESAPIRNLSISPEDQTLTALTNNRILQMKINSRTASMTEPITVASVDQPHSIAVS